MQTSRARGSLGAAKVLALVALPATLLGCGGPAAPPLAPSGGQQLVLSYDQFGLSVEPVLMRRGCDATADCHGGGIRGTLQLSPPGAKNARFDFDQVVLQVLASPREASPILTEPLALGAGGTPHAFKPSTTTADSDYIAIRQWIESGVLR